MPLYRVQVELRAATGVPNDKATNVWHFTADDEAELLSGPVVQLTTFYAAIDGTFSNLVATTGHRLRAYDLADPEPRAPVIDQGLGTLSVGTTPLPPECAIVVSFQAPQQSGQLQTRRRGRLYFGPLAQSTLDTAGRFSPTTVTTYVTAAQNLVDASDAATTWHWHVYSRVNQASIAVTNGWVDNAVDIQRRRGTEATSRTTFTA